MEKEYLLELAEKECDMEVLAEAFQKILTACEERHINVCVSYSLDGGDCITEAVVANDYSQITLW